MIKPSRCAWLVAAACTLPAYAMNIQPDPQNPGGYLVSSADIKAAEQGKTANPMYATWSRALATRPNTVVDAIEPGLVSTPDNVKRAERVFPASEWEFLTQMAAPEYT
ncbi:carbohydrate-binding protein, partial [Aeromonas salmonicida]